MRNPAEKKTETKKYIARAAFLSERGQVLAGQEVETDAEEAGVAMGLKLTGEQDGIFSK